MVCKGVPHSQVVVNSIKDPDDNSRILLSLNGLTEIGGQQHVSFSLKQSKQEF